jgi:hypothetical protein
MQTETFETQSALLGYLGKNVNDRSLIKRMMERWEVFKQDGLYHLVVDGLEKREKKSETNAGGISDNELNKLKRMNEKLMAAYKKLSKEKEVYMWMYDHLVFFYGKFEKYKKFVEWKVFGQTEYNKKNNETQETMEMNRPKVYERYNFEYWEVEMAEEEAVEKIIAQRNKELDEIPF